MTLRIGCKGSAEQFGPRGLVDICTSGKGTDLNADRLVPAVKTSVEPCFDHLVFRTPGHDRATFLEALGKDIAPGLRELGKGAT